MKNTECKQVRPADRVSKRGKLYAEGRGQKWNEGVHRNAKATLTERSNDCSKGHNADVTTNGVRALEPEEDCQKVKRRPGHGQPGAANTQLTYFKNFEVGEVRVFFVSSGSAE